MYDRLLRRIVVGHPRTFLALAGVIASYLALRAWLGGQTRAIAAWDIGPAASLG